MRSLGPLLALAVFLPSAARADVFMAGPADDVEAAIGMLAPGDELVLAGGMYVLDQRFSFDIAGTEAMPIVIRAQDGETPHFHRPTADQNIWDIDRAEHVVLRGLEFSGGSAGLRISAARFLTIEDCEIHDTGDVALRANDGGAAYEGLRILRNHIHHTNGTGEGMYLGCNSDGCRVFDSLIEGNYVHHTNQATVEQGDGIEVKEGGHDNVIRDNVIHDTNYPCILVDSAAGHGGPNLVERNALWGCGAPGTPGIHAIQASQDAVIRNNVILSAGDTGIAIGPHQAGVPQNVVVVHNTVLQPDGDALTLRGAVGSVLIANNAIYAQTGRAMFVNGGTSTVTVSGNVVAGAVEGFTTGFTTGDLAADFVMAHYDGTPPIDVFPAAGGALPGAGDATHVVADDFNGTARMGVADVGAYAFDPDGNPGWVITEGFRDAPDPPPPDDGGVPGDGGPPPLDAGGGRDGGGGTDGGGGRMDGGGGGGSDGGCGCRTAAGAGGAWPLALVLLALIGRGGRRRRRR